MRLDREVAMITGGAMGIGAAVARLFAREGAAVVIADIDDSAAGAVLDEIRAAGGSTLYVRCDVGRQSAVDAAVATAVEAFGRLTVAVFSAGIDVTGTVVDASEESWQRCLRTNLGGVFHGMKAALPAMLAAGHGSIVSVSSIQALRGFHAYAAYAAAKGGVVALTRQVACDYGPRRVRANTICPSTVATPMTQAELDSSDDPGALMARWITPHPLGRIGMPDDVAQAALFLASEESAWLTGQTLVVDGGVTASGFH